METGTGTAARQRTIGELAREAIAVQDACNLIAVARGFVRAIDGLRDAGHTSTAELREHAIVRLWADKIAHLAGVQYGANLSQAYDDAIEIGKGL